MVLLWAGSAAAQTCTTLGQNPGTAFPVCGTDTFSQSTVPLCGNRSVPASCGVTVTDKNPFWYRFTCFTAGTLGFAITPVTLAEDYDWQLFDITGRNPSDVYTDPSLVISYNWSGEFGITGASSAGTSLFVCEGTGRPLWSGMPTLIKDHVYLLLISHFTDTQSGYSLSFGGGTASITDTMPPKLKNATGGCGGITINLRLNKKMKCNSLALNGSDFALSPAVANIISASAIGCSNSFDMDSITFTVNSALPPGTYSLIAKKGADGNTLLDYCDDAVPVGDQVSFTVFPVFPTPMDSISPIRCAPDSLQLVFRKPMFCNSIAADGSDFILSGPGGNTIVGASGNCNAQGLSRTIKLKLSSPIVRAGVYQVMLVSGSDGNTIIDECGQFTPAGATLSITASDTVSAAFTYQITYGCKADTIDFFHDGRNSVNQWAWELDKGFSNIPNPQKIYTTFGQKQVRLYVSNGVCSDSTTEDILLHDDAKVTAGFTAPDIACPQDMVVFKDTSIGKVISWNWDFGNGFTNNMQSPPAQMFQTPFAIRETKFTVSLIVKSAGCADTTSAIIKAVNSCYITVPSAFTPNNDNTNDFLYPLNAFKADKLSFKVFNRYGQLVFETTDWMKRWDGTIRGKLQPTGVYVWILNYTDRDTNKRVSLKGTSILIR